MNDFTSHEHSLVLGMKLLGPLEVLCKIVERQNGRRMKGSFVCQKKEPDDAVRTAASRCEVQLWLLEDDEVFVLFVQNGFVREFQAVTLSIEQMIKISRTRIALQSSN